MKKLIPVVFTALTFTSFAHAASTNPPLFEKEADSVVRIFTESGADSGFDPAKVQAVGSGIHMSNGYIATAPNVIAGLDNILVFEDVKGEDGNRKYYVHRANLLAFDRDAGAAIVKCSDMHSTGLAYAKNVPKREDIVYSVGFDDTRRDGDLIAAVAQAINPTWDKQTTWDITDLVQKAELDEAFLCVEPSGNIEKLVTRNLRDGKAVIPVLRIGVPQEDGMAGSPLLNADGQLEGLQLGPEFPDFEGPNYGLPLSVVVDQLRHSMGQK
jgi:hypothetical protein